MTTDSWTPRWFRRSKTRYVFDPSAPARDPPQPIVLHLLRLQERLPGRLPARPRPVAVLHDGQAPDGSFAVDERGTAGGDAGRSQGRGSDGEGGLSVGRICEPPWRSFVGSESSFNASPFHKSPLADPSHISLRLAQHYITYRLLPHTNRWLRISDDDVLELPEGGGEEVWKWGGRGEVVLLFYERLVGTRLADGQGEGAGCVFRAGSATPSATGGTEAQEQENAGGRLPSTSTPPDRPPSPSIQDLPSPPTPSTPDAVDQAPSKEETAVEDESAPVEVDVSAPAGGEAGGGQKKRKKKTRKK